MTAVSIHGFVVILPTREGTLSLVLGKALLACLKHLMKKHAPPSAFASSLKFFLNH